MYRARAFFYVCVGILLLALSYHLGAGNAGAQAPGNPIVAIMPTSAGSLTAIAVTSGGDVYGASNLSGPWSLLSNVFGGPTPSAQQTLGQLKARYR